MMTMAELNLRAAKDTWEKAKLAWQQSVMNINAAKIEWQNAEAEFYGERNVMSSAASCGTSGGCSGCTSGGCK